jgi:hypothetical protein
VLGSVEWRALHADDGAYRDWRGRHRLGRQLTVGGGLDAICERRGEQVGIALHGNLAVDERVRVSIRSGPDQLTATAKHTVSGWLALGADGRPTSIELRDDVETDGRFGGPYGDAFTQRASWSTAGPDVLTAAEQHAVTELIAAAAAGTGGDAGLGANVLAYRGAGARLTAMGRLVVPAIVDACCGSTDHTARQRLTAVLRAIAGDAM